MADGGLELFADGFAFMEVPRWHDGQLWAADLFTGEVIAFTGDGAAQVVVAVPDVLCQRTSRSGSSRDRRAR
jgi:hypothetical protein